MAALAGMGGLGGQWPLVGCYGDHGKAGDRRARKPVVLSGGLG